MATYYLVGHLLPKDTHGGGTMSGCSKVETESDEAAVQHFINDWNLNPQDLSADDQATQRFSVYKLCPPPKQ